eukprot:UN07374
MVQDDGQLLLNKLLPYAILEYHHNKIHRIVQSELIKLLNSDSIRRFCSRRSSLLSSATGTYGNDMVP